MCIRDRARNPSESNDSDGILDSGLLSVTRNFETISSVNTQQSFLTYELVRDDDVNRFATGTQNLFLGALSLQASTDNFDMTRAITVFPTEENLAVRIQMAGSAGQSFNGNSGGEGGRCTFTTTLQKGVEYTFKLGATVEPTASIGRGGAGAYFYEKGRLLVACGGGGASGWYGGSGGDGGGAGVAGSSGGGSSGGDGGQSVSAGQLPAEGEVPTGGTGGKVESCTSGDYWQSQGVDPCNDVGNVKFRTFDGTEVSSSATIQRGYKGDGGPENGFRFNGGQSFYQVNGTYVGGGGAGAYGGNATASTNSGGGGGSGYTNGSVNIISTSSENDDIIGFAQIELL